MQHFSEFLIENILSRPTHDIVFISGGLSVGHGALSVHTESVILSSKPLTEKLKLLVLQLF